MFKVIPNGGITLSFIEKISEKVGKVAMEKVELGKYDAFKWKVKWTR